MEKSERLKQGRNILLRLHKRLVDHERSIYENLNGPVSSGQFLNLLIEDPDFAWLRKFSTLIVEIDEMFDQADSIDPAVVDQHLAALRRLISMEGESEEFTAKYQAALQQDIDAAADQGGLKALLET